MSLSGKDSEMIHEMAKDSETGQMVSLLKWVMKLARLTSFIKWAMSGQGSGWAWIHGRGFNVSFGYWDWNINISSYYDLFLSFPSDTCFNLSAY